LTTKIIFGEEYRSQSTWLCSYLPSLLTSSHLSWNVLPSILFSKTLRLCSCRSVTDQVLRRYQAKDKFIILVYVNFYDWNLYSLKKIVAGSPETKVSALLWSTILGHYHLSRHPM
jgi:hypothetical protein